jgi:hypothetical protein
MGKQFVRPYLEKTHYKKGLVEWLKVKALSSSPRTTKKKKKGLNGEKCYVNFSSRKSEGERKTVSDKPTMRYCQQTCAARNV